MPLRAACFVDIEGAEHPVPHDMLARCSTIDDLWRMLAHNRQHWFPFIIKDIHLTKEHNTHEDLAALQ